MSNELDHMEQIIARERITVVYLPKHKEWWATHPKNEGGLLRFHGSGPTRLLAAMRCHVESKEGDKAKVSEVVREFLNRAQ